MESMYWCGVGVHERCGRSQGMLGHSLQPGSSEISAQLCLSKGPSQTLLKHRVCRVLEEA